MLRSKLTLGAALIGASFVASCAYEPAPAPYAYNPGYYSYDPAYYGYAYDPGYYDYGYGYGPAFYGYYDTNHHWHNRRDRDWNRADWERSHRDHRDWNRNNVNAQPRENFNHSTAQAPRKNFQRGNQTPPTQLGNRSMQGGGGGGDRDRRDWNH